MMKTEHRDTLSSKEVADDLADRLGGTPSRWATWLANDRRPGRAHLLPPLRGPGRLRYLRAALDAYVDAERSRRARDTTPAGRVAEALRAFGIGEEGGSSTGRRLDCQVLEQRDDGDGKPFVQVVVAKPLLVFRLEPDEAHRLAASLIAAARAAGPARDATPGERGQP